MIVGGLFFSVSLSHLKREKIKALLTLFGISLGIAVYTAIRLANQNALDSFEASIKLASGTTPFMIVGKGPGLLEESITTILKMPEIKHFMPQSSRYVKGYAGERSLGTIKVLGLDLMQAGTMGIWGDPKDIPPSFTLLDLFYKKNRVLASPQLIAEMGDHSFYMLAHTRKIKIEVSDLPINGSLSNVFGGKVVVMDIANYQDLFSEFGKIDSLNITLHEKTDLVEFDEALQRRTKGMAFVTTPEKKFHQASVMTEAFQLNLRFLSCISLLVSLLLIYNMVSYTVLKRRRELGILQAIGAKPKTLFMLISLEAVLGGLVSSLMGLVMGVFFASYALGHVSVSISNLYFPMAATDINLNLPIVLECILLGPFLALTGSFIPLLEIFRNTPGENFNYQDFEKGAKQTLSWITRAGILSLLLSFAFAQDRFLQFHIFMGFVSPIFLVIGTVLLVPISLNLMIKLGMVVLRRGMIFELTLALDHIRMTLFRNAVAIASVMISLGMFIGVSVMIMSFRATVQDWIVHITKADIFISTAYPISGSKGGYLPVELIDELTVHPEVSNFDWITSTSVLIKDRKIRINGVRFETIYMYDRLLLKKRMSPEELQWELQKEGRVLVSETFANRFNISPGDSIQIPGERKIVQGVVANVYYDYSSDQGVILIPFSQFEKMYGTSKKQGFSLFLKPGVSSHDFLAMLRTRYEEHNLRMQDNHSLRKAVLNIFDQTFQITYALQVIALTIAALTILNTILMLILERKREFGVMRAIGASRRMLLRMIVVESSFLGVASLIGGIVQGLGLSLILVFVVNKFFFAWSVHFFIPWGLLGTAALGTLVLAFFAGLGPGLYMTKRLDAKVLRYE